MCPKNSSATVASGRPDPEIDWPKPDTLLPTGNTPGTTRWRLPNLRRAIVKDTATSASEHWQPIRAVIRRVLGSHWICEDRGYPVILAPT